MSDVDYDDASVERELGNKDRVGEKFADRFIGLSWKITGQNGTLIRNFRRSLPGISDKDFNKIISDLTKGEVVDSKLPEKTATVAEKAATKKKTERKKIAVTNPPKEADKESKQTVANQETKKEPVVSAAAEEDPEQEELRKSEAKKQDLLKTLYEGKNTKYRRTQYKQPLSSLTN